MSSEITDAVQVIHILFEGTDLFIRVAGAGIQPIKQLTKLITGILMKEKMEGKTSMKDLLKRGGDMQVFRFPQEQIKKVEAMAKKYGILYSLLPDFGKDGMREMVFHAQSLPRMNAMIEKLKTGQVGDLEEYLRNTNNKDIDRFYEENRMERDMAEKQAEAAAQHMESKAKDVGSPGRETHPLWMDTGYFKIKDIEAIPLNERLDILNHYQSGAYDPITITAKLVIKEEGNHVVVRLPREPDKFIHIPKADFWFPEGSRTALAFLKKRDAMTIYGVQGGEIRTMIGGDIFKEYFDIVNANIRTVMEQEREERAVEKSADRADTVKKANDMVKVKDMGKELKEMKQPVKGR